MLNYLTLILVCQLVGELLAQSLAVPVPGPVIGMVILFVFLLVRGSVPVDLAIVADTLLNHLGLLFVPAGVGVMLHFGLLGDQWLAVTVAVFVSTGLTIAVTGLVMTWLDRGRDAAENTERAKD